VVVMIESSLRRVFAGRIAVSIVVEESIGYAIRQKNFLRYQKGLSGFWGMGRCARFLGIYRGSGPPLASTVLSE
jgi:hypothetical protein